ncbi:MAG: class I SAM-dependent methyltransferase [Burkholderiales bacterium]|nr:class I SAM-dependent methyltransferase [Burkholderiales bacterium]
MKKGHASETAYRAARARARHQVLDYPRVFEDPMAPLLLREADRVALRQGTAPRGGAVARGLRMALALRSRIAEDALHDAVRRGVKQYVVLGAGLDTFAFRNPYPPEALRVFEVDHPDTQAGKRELAAQAGLAIPPGLQFVPVDFATQALAPQLAAAGFDPRQPAFFSFLGVSMYLEPAALESTLRYVASCARGSEVVFDYVVDPGKLSFIDRMMLRLVALRVGLLGEKMKSFLDPATLPDRLLAMGFGSSHDQGSPEVAARIRATLPADAPARPPRFGMGGMVRACV